MVSNAKKPGKKAPLSAEASAESKITLMIQQSQKLYAKGDYKDALAMCEAGEKQPLVPLLFAPEIHSVALEPHTLACHFSLRRGRLQGG